MMLLFAGGLVTQVEIRASTEEPGSPFRELSLTLHIGGEKVSIQLLMGVEAAGMFLRETQAALGKGAKEQAGGGKP